MSTKTELKTGDKIVSKGKSGFICCSAGVAGSVGRIVEKTADFIKIIFNECNCECKAGKLGYCASTFVGEFPYYFELVSTETSLTVFSSRFEHLDLE